MSPPSRTPAPPPRPMLYPVPGNAPSDRSLASIFSFTITAAITNERSCCPPWSDRCEFAAVRAAKDEKLHCSKYEKPNHHGNDAIEGCEANCTNEYSPEEKEYGKKRHPRLHSHHEDSSCVSLPFGHAPFRGISARPRRLQQAGPAMAPIPPGQILTSLVQSGEAPPIKTKRPAVKTAPQSRMRNSSVSASRLPTTQSGDLNIQW